MSLFLKIKDAQLAARKAKDKSASLLTTLLAEVVKIGVDDGKRDTTDDEAMKVLTTFIKNVKQNITTLQKSNRDDSEMQYELSILNLFLPAQVDTSVLAELAKKVKSDGGNVGQFIKEVKQTFQPGTFNPAELKSIYDHN